MRQEELDVTAANRALLKEVDERSKLVIEKRKKALEKPPRTVRDILWHLHDSIPVEVLETWAINNIGTVLTLLAKTEEKNGSTDNATSVNRGVQILNQFFAVNGRSDANVSDGGMGKEGLVLPAEVHNGEEGR